MSDAYQCIDPNCPDARFYHDHSRRDLGACTFLLSHFDRPAVARHYVAETGETFNLCEDCARDLGFHDGD